MVTGLFPILHDLPLEVSLQGFRLRGAGVIVPPIFPAPACLLRNPRVGVDAGEGAVQRIKNGLRGAPGFTERFVVDQLPVLVVVTEDLLEESSIPTTPAVDRLFDISDAEEGAVLCAGNDFLKEVGQHSVLASARVLKLVEEPVVELDIQPLVDH